MTPRKTTVLYPARPESMQPTLPEKIPSSLEDCALKLAVEVASLNSSVHPVARRALEGAFRYANSYYSNLIEGNSTHPVDIEQAVREGAPRRGAARGKIIEATAHVEAQQAIEALLPGLDDTAVFSETFLKKIHFELYSRIPESDRRAPGMEKDGPPLPVLPGEFRTHFVQVGSHIAPRAEELGRFLQFFKFRYTLPESLTGIRRLVAVACAHHRLLWIHPFTDGNGRVARLFTHAAFIKAGLGGPWSVNRGLARARAEYMRRVAAADMDRQGSGDGRGNLSQRALIEFAGFFLECALEQASFTRAFLSLPTLAARMQVFLAGHPEGEIRKAAVALGRILRECLAAGEVPRGAVAEIIGKSDRTATTLIGLLSRQGLVQSVSPKAALRIAFPQKVLPYYFPAFLPEK